MIHNIAKRFTEYVIQMGYVDKSKFDEYLYGLELTLIVLLNSVTVMLIGIIMQMLMETIIFWLTYNILKKYVGGFHFSSTTACYASTCIMCPIVLWVIKYSNYTIDWSIVLISEIILILLAPVETIQKPLDEKERLFFKKIAIMLSLISLVICLILVLLNYNYAAKVISIGIISVAIFAILGKLKNLKVHHN